MTQAAQSAAPMTRVTNLIDGRQEAFVEPDVDTLTEWVSDAGCETPDGCWVEPDGACEHGWPSWLSVLGLI